MNAAVKKFFVWSLFLAGLFFEFSAFLVDHAEQIGFSRKIILCDLYLVEKAFLQLEDARSIKKGDWGFEAFERFIMGKLKTDRIRQLGYDISGNLESGFAKIEHRLINKDDERLNAPTNIQIRAHLQDGGRLVLNRDALKNSIAERISFRILWVSAGIFVFGALLQLIGFAIN